MQEYKIKKENGRSMIEMLGVLAIIGVLSISAISGFRSAMDKHKANQVLNDVALGLAELKMREVVYADEEVEFDFDTESGLDMVGYVDNVGNDYVAVTGISKGICKKLLPLKNVGSLGLIYQVDAATELTECTDEPQIMVFAEKNADTQTGAGNTGGDNNSGGNDNIEEDNEQTTPSCEETCVNGFCKNGVCSCFEGWTGTNCTHWIDENMCRDGTKCPEGEICSASGCSRCGDRNPPICEMYQYDGFCASIMCCGKNETPFCYEYETDHGGCRMKGCCDGIVKEMDDGHQACCSDETGKAYCVGYNSDGLCFQTSCCEGEQKLKEVYGIEACCFESETAYCISYNDDGSCSSAGCCSGMVTKNENGKAVCSS